MAVTFSTISATVPDQPLALDARGNGQTQIELTWVSPSSDGGTAITGYKIEVAEQRPFVWSDLVSNTDSTTTSYSHTGLTAGATRHYRISAINSVGIGPASIRSWGSTDLPNRPGQPTGLTAVGNKETQIVLTWSAPSSNGGAPITGYQIESSWNGSSWGFLVGNSHSASTSFTHTRLQAGTTRYYRISAINVAGAGPVSNTASGTTATRAVTGSNRMECLKHGSYPYQMFVVSTVTAHRRVTDVVVTGKVDGVSFGTKNLGNMAAGETRKFTVSGYYRPGPGAAYLCSYSISYSEIN